MELLRDSDQLAVIKMLNTFGKHSNVVCAYTELFGICPTKTKMKKWRVLLEEMKRLFDSESFTYQSRLHQISQAGIVEALNVVIRRNFPDHLENHNYLKKIMITIAEREFQSKSRQDDKDLQRKIENLSYPVQEERVEAPEPASQPAEADRSGEYLSPEENVRRARQIARGIFK